MIEQFREVNLRPAAIDMIEQANKILEEFRRDDIQLTVRGLHYQYVRRNWYENTQENYRKLVSVVSKGRIGGLINWSALEDLERTPSMPAFYDSKADFVQSLRNSADYYTLDHWQNQKHYVELWVEKKALSGMLKPVAEQWDVGFVMNKGYGSQTALYDASKRFIEAARKKDREPVLLYVGDHDPSGEDMVRDVRDRLAMFCAPYDHHNRPISVEVRKVALTFAQVKQYKCPPNPAKFKDPRADEYIAKFGKKSWETEALDPKDLRRIVEAEIRALVNIKTWNKTMAQEKNERVEIQEVLEGIA